MLICVSFEKALPCGTACYVMVMNQSALQDHHGHGDNDDVDDGDGDDALSGELHEGGVFDIRLQKGGVFRHAGLVRADGAFDMRHRNGNCGIPGTEDQDARAREHDNRRVGRAFPASQMCR